MTHFSKRLLIGSALVVFTAFSCGLNAFGIDSRSMDNSKILKISTEMEVFPQNSTTNLILRDMDVPTVLRLIAKEGKKNIVLDESVKGVINADLKKVSLNQALQTILTSQELEARVEGNTIFVASRPAMAKKGLNRKYIKAFKLNNSNAVEVSKILEASIFNKGYQVTETAAAPAQPAQTQAAPAQATAGTPPTGATVQAVASSGTTTGQSALVQTKTIRGKVEAIEAGSGFGDAEKLASEIKIQSVSSSQQDITVSNNDGGAIVIPDTRTNSVLVSGLKEDIDLAEQAIKYLDKPLPQVSIEVSLVELKKDKNNDYNLSLGSVAGKTGFNFNNLTAGENYGQIGIDSVKSLSDAISVRVKASLTNGKARLLANPTVLALDGSESLIKITDQIVSKMTVTATTQGLVTYSPELADIGIVLNILPKIGSDGYVTMRIRPSITTPLEKVTVGDGFATLISTREVIVQDARVKAGETLAIAGLIKDQEIEKISKMPIVSEMPVFGSLFTNRNIDKTKSELVILITPKLVQEHEAN